MCSREFLEDFRVKLASHSLGLEKSIVMTLLDELGWEASLRLVEGIYTVLSLEGVPLMLWTYWAGTEFAERDRKESLGYAKEAEIKWVVFTDGDRFEIYPTAADRPYLVFQISDERRMATHQIFRLLSKESLEKGSLDQLYAESIAVEPARERVVSGGDLETLCSEYRDLSAQIEALTERKSELSQMILSQLKEKNTVTSRFKILKMQRVLVKTSLESARLLGCTVQTEEVDKDALKRLHEEGIPVPNIQLSESIRVTATSN